MVACIGQTGRRQTNAAFTLVEVVLSIAILALAMSGMIYGYVQTNYRAEWSSMSLAAQSFASQAVERVRAAQWDYFRTYTNQIQQLPSTYKVTNTMLLASSGRTTNVVTTVTITNMSTGSAPLYQFCANCVWYFPRTGANFTNIVITQRAPDQ
jgi:prepilin-type N-terminal cleavage/methylation domain-containing protein